MTSTSTTPDRADTVDAARNAVIAERATLADWEDKLSQTRGDLAALEESAGDQILDDPSAADQIESRLTVLRSSVRAAERAVAAQRPRVTVAESRYLAAEADALEAPLSAARAELDQHEAKTQRLLAQLEKHEGVYVPELDLINLRRSIAASASEGPQSWRVPRSHLLRQAVRVLEDQVTILREMAAGRDPREWVRAHRSSIVSGPQVEYPDCVTGPDALVPTHAFLASVDRMRQTVTDLENLLEHQLPDEIAEWTAKEQHAIRGSEEEAAARAGVRRREARLQQLPAELAEARRALAEMTGEEEPDEEEHEEQDEVA